MKITVVMTTYNGEKFILEQLDSLRNQSREIDEVLILDDCSKDETINIISEYIKFNKLDKWKIIKNNYNIGWKRNFYEGFKLATGDIIFPCDQDDIWHEDKIEKMASIIEANDNINVLEGQYNKYFIKKESSNKKNICLSIVDLWGIMANLIDKASDKSLKKKNNGVIIKRNFNRDFLKLTPACCMCIRTSFFKKIESLWFEELGHDAYVTFYSLLEESYYIYMNSVIEWRHYSGSTSRPKTRCKNIRKQEIDRDKKVIESMERYLYVIDDKKIADKLKILEKAKKWNVNREKFINTKNFIYAFKNIKYIGYYERNRAIITDWIYTYFMD